MTDDRMGTVSRAMAVMTAIAEADSEVAIIDLAKRLDLPQSTCHRLLDLLAADGFVTRNAKLRRYGPGPSLQRVAALVAGRTDLGKVALPIIERLTAESGETSLVGRYSELDRTLFFTQAVDAPNPLRYRIDLYVPEPVALGASGRAVVAWLSRDEQEAAFEPVRDRWPSFEAFEAELQEIRDRGFALSSGEKIDEAVGIAAPVRGLGDKLIGSITTTIPRQRFDKRRLGEIAALVMEAAKQVSLLCGSGKAGEERH